MKSRIALAGALLLLAGTASAANRPAGYVTICTEGKTCSVAANTNVAFGRADKFFYKVLSGSFVCNEATFGGKVAGGTNECSVPSGTSSSSSVSSVSSSKSSSSVASSVASSSSSLASSSVASSSSSKSSVASSSQQSQSGAYVSGQGYYPGCKMPTPTETVQLTATHVVPANTVFDGGNKRYNLSGGSQAEGQPAVIDVQDGGTVKNVIIGSLAADGIHCLGSCTLQNVWWEDIGEDAATALGPVGSVMSINCGGAYNGSDKTFQHNGRGEFRLSNFYIQTSGKVYRSCGDCTANGGPRKSTITNVATRDVKTYVGINLNYGDNTTIRSVILDNTGDARTKLCQGYIGKVKGEGSSETLGVFWNTAQCNVRPEDVTLLGPSRTNPGECSISDCSAYQK
ncbi:pectate lyase [Viridibacterium curvum]|uniref:Pectate lyase n=1 Tax=Viridibacterium curvum TaxID=1101404 RepID=A0ABP9QYM8_9RHOO